MFRLHHYVSDSLRIIGGISRGLLYKLDHLDIKTKQEVFKDFPLKDSPEETFSSLAQWVEGLQKEKYI